MKREEKERIIKGFEKELAEIKKRNKEEFKYRYMRQHFGGDGFYSKLKTLGGILNDNRVG